MLNRREKTGMPWKRNKGSSTGAKVPAEVEQYYESSRKERVGIAWLLALATLLLTVLIAAVLFFAGRWAFNRIFNNDNDSATPTSSEEAPSAEDPSIESRQGEGQESNDQNSQQGNSQGTVNAPANPAPSPTPSTPPAAPNPSQTPTTGGEEIPRTGPDGEE